MFDSMRIGVALTAVAGCLVCSACGGSSAGDHPPAATPSAAKAPGPSGAGPVSAAAAITRKCAAADAADPGQFTVCLASHGLKLPDSGAVTACIQRAHDRSALEACLSKGVR